MKLNANLIKQIEKIVGNENVKIDEPMKRHTSFKVGGPADLMVCPRTYSAVKDLIELLKKENVDYFIMGNGSNVIVKDGGIRGVVVDLTCLDGINIEDNIVVAQCGALLSLVARSAFKNKLTGLEFAAGIPGTIGGAVAMNAGAYDGEMSHVIESALIIDEEGSLKELSVEELELGYRSSVILKKGYIVLETRLKLSEGNEEQIKNRMDELAKRRKDKQPLEYPSAGSTFKRPVGYFAGKLIEDAGLKGRSVGGAQVSEKHSGFIINKENATAKDIVDLIHVVQKDVFDMFGVELQTEVRIVGEDI